MNAWQGRNTEGRMLFSFLLISKATSRGGGSEGWGALGSAAYRREGKAAERRFAERHPAFRPKGRRA